MGSKRRREAAHEEAKDTAPKTSLPDVLDGQDSVPTQHEAKQKSSTAGSQGQLGIAPANQQPSKPQAAPVLPWMRVPILIEAGSGVPLQQVPGLDPRLQHAMSGGPSNRQQKQEARKQHVRYTELFPVQSVVWSELAGGTSTAHDLCIAAPTGSGKTLAYALPIVNGLARQPDCARLRTLQALVVLPTRDLAVQVHSVFSQLCPAVGLNLGLAAAQVSLPAEAQELMGGGQHQRSPLTQHRPCLLPGQLPPSLEESDEACLGIHSQRGQQGISGVGQGQEGWGAAGQGSVDVLVATPGRLMAHLTHTPGFTLDHLRFLVVDETDRLLRQSYQEWLPRVLGQLHSPSHFAHTWAAAMSACSNPAPPSGVNPLLTHRSAPLAHPAQTLRDGGLAARDVRDCTSFETHASASTATGTGVSGLAGMGMSSAGFSVGRDVGVAHHVDDSCFRAGGLGGGGSLGVWGSAVPMPHSVPRTVKVVVSATLTRDPSKLQRLELHCPRYIATSAQDHRYHLPRSLQEFKVLCSGARKPLTLMALLQELRHESTIVFASSLEITHKLYLMLQQVLGSPGSMREKHEVVEFSSHLNSSQRASALEQLRTGRAKVLVASDAMTRGMDVDNVQNIVNYDAPVYAKTYVHRAGRTARAGRSGRVFTLLRDEDVRHFKQMLRKADNTFVKNFKLAPGVADSFKPALEAALKQVQELLEAEAQDDHKQQSDRKPPVAKQQQQQHHHHHNHQLGQDACSLGGSKSQQVLAAADGGEAQTRPGRESGFHVRAKEGDSALRPRKRQKEEP